MIDNMLTIIPVGTHAPSVISVLLIFCSFWYLERGQRLLIKELASIRANHSDLKIDFTKTKNTLNTDIAEIKTALKTLPDIKQDIRDMRNKIFK